ncbi:MAG: hypothetical protein M9924_21845 [Rhizobiaceae bacterium]|nr:hypothetical protein [Rhizobiaceae bacterium]
MKAACFITIIACATVLSGCAGYKERLAKCSADENPVGALAYGEKPETGNAGAIVAQQMTDECGPMRPVNQF